MAVMNKSIKTTHNPMCLQPVLYVRASLQSQAFSTAQ